MRPIGLRGLDNLRFAMSASKVLPVRVSREIHFTEAKCLFHKNEIIGMGMREREPIIVFTCASSQCYRRIHAWRVIAATE